MIPSGCRSQLRGSHVDPDLAPSRETAAGFLVLAQRPYLRHTAAQDKKESTRFIFDPQRLSQYTLGRMRQSQCITGILDMLIRQKLLVAAAAIMLVTGGATIAAPDFVSTAHAQGASGGAAGGGGPGGAGGPGAGGGPGGGPGGGAAGAAAAGGVGGPADSGLAGSQGAATAEAATDPETRGLEKASEVVGTTPAGGVEAAVGAIESALLSVLSAGTDNDNETETTE